MMDDERRRRLIAAALDLQRPPKETAMDDHAGMGHNAGPAIPLDYADKAREFLDVGGKWSDKGAPVSDEEAERLNDFLTGARGFRKKLDEKRAELKKPHDEAAAAVQAAFKPTLDALDKMGVKIRKLLTDYAAAKQAELDRQRREAEAEAKRQAEEAAAAARAAEERGDFVGQAEAEAAQKAVAKGLAKIERESRVKIGSATGAGRTAAVKTIYRAEIVSIGQAFAHYRDNAEIRALLVRLAEADMRAAKDKAAFSVPGFAFKAEQSVV